MRTAAVRQVASAGTGSDPRRLDERSLPCIG